MDDSSLSPNVIDLPGVAPDADDATSGWLVAQTSGDVLTIGGRIVGAAATEAFCSVLDCHNPPEHYVLDVDAVEVWSLVAQSMILLTARRERVRGSLFLLRGGSAALHAQSSRFGLFDRVATVDVAGVPRNLDNIAHGG